MIKIFLCILYRNTGNMSSVKATLSALPLDLQRLIAQKTMNVKDLSIQEIANIIDLKTKNTVFRAVDIVPSLVKFFTNGKWNIDDTDFREDRISWRPLKENTFEYSIDGEIYIDENKVVFNNITVVDKNGVALTRFSKAFNDSKMTYIRKKYLSKGWNFAFLVAAHYKYPRKVTKQACIDFFEQLPEAEIFKQLLSQKQSSKSATSSSAAASTSPLLSPKSKMLAEGEQFIQQRRRQLKEEAESMKKAVLGHDAAVRTFLTKKTTKTAEPTKTRRYNLRSHAKSGNKANI